MCYVIVLLRYHLFIVHVKVFISDTEKEGKTKSYVTLTRRQYKKVHVTVDVESVQRNGREICVNGKKT